MRSNFICLLCLVFAFFSSKPDSNKSPELKKVTNNVKTSLHQLVKGTKIYMIPPPGFSPSTSMAGFTMGKRMYSNHSMHTVYSAKR